jgi:hypothetical protein
MYAYFKIEMKQIINFHKFCIVKVRASLERQQEYETNMRETRIMLDNISKLNKMDSSWLFTMYLQRN